MNAMHTASFVFACLALAAMPAQEPAPPAPTPPEPVSEEPVLQDAEPGEIVLGSGRWRFAWTAGWGRLPDGKEIGNTHGCLVVDRSNRILANTDTEQAVLIFDTAGKVVGAWGKDYRGGLHGMTARFEAGVEYLYLVHTGRHEALKTTLDGKVVWTLGWPEASGIYQNENEYRPTAIAVGPDGRVFVADGYGKSWLHLYDKDRSYVKSFGGPGTEPGKLRTPHGLLLDTRGKEPLLLVCDRENHRLQWFTMDGEFVRMHDRDLRRPCNAVILEEGVLAIADLAGRVTLLDREHKLIAHLGDNPDEKKRAQNGIPRDQWQDGVFLSPHGICADRDGNLYVLDWNFLGRVSQLRRVR